MVTAALKRARETIVRGENVPIRLGSLKNFYMKLGVCGDDLLLVNYCGQDCRENFFETEKVITAIFKVEITPLKQGDDQLVPSSSMVKVSMRSAGFRNGGGAVAILRQGRSMWITILQ